MAPLPGRSAVYRALIRQGLIMPGSGNGGGRTTGRWGPRPGDAGVADDMDGPRLPGRRPGGQDR